MNLIQEISIVFLTSERRTTRRSEPAEEGG